MGRRVQESKMHEWAQMQGRRRGFTLIELLVVISVIAVLASLLMPVINRAMEHGAASRCMGHLRQLTQACIMYAHQFNSIIVFAQGRPGSYKTMFMQEALQAHGRIDVRVIPCPAEMGLTAKDWDTWEASWRRTQAPLWWYTYNRAYYITELARPGASTTKCEVLLTTEVRNPGNVVYWSDGCYYAVYYRQGCDPTYPENRDSNMQRRISFRHMDGLNLIFFDYHGEWMLGKDVHPRMWCPTKWK